ncbi:MAG: DUF4156 domain-containing protein [Myxococcota bacterium]
MKSIQLAAAVAACLWVPALAACTWVPLVDGAKDVGVLTERAAEGCKRLGKTTANTTESVVFIPRGKARVRWELESMARNAAVRMGGDAVAALGPVTDGRQDFGIYRCAPAEPAAPGDVSE